MLACNLSSLGMLAAVDAQHLDPLIPEGLQNSELLISSSLPYLLAENF